MQSRHVLPGWYGLGAALEQFAQNQNNQKLLQEMYQHWPFFKSTIDNAQMAMGKADMGIARLYAGLVEDERIRSLIFGDIETEFYRTRRAILSISNQQELLDNEPVLQRSIQARNPYVDPLNYIQVSLLRQLRALPDLETPEAQPILQSIFLTINGIAAGLKNTG
jgi:phosphoenolpyruvate carboxylase